MTLRGNTIKGVILVALPLVLGACDKPDQSGAEVFPTGNAESALTAADCEKLPDPKPVDDSAAGRARAVSEGAAARASCRKSVNQDTASADLQRIREIKEAERADQASAMQSDGEFRKGIKEGGARPVRDFKF